jgi:hypothetical protein
VAPPQRPRPTHSAVSQQLPGSARKRVENRVDKNRADTDDIETDDGDDGEDGDDNDDSDAVDDEHPAGKAARPGIRYVPSFFIVFLLSFLS